MNRERMGNSSLSGFRLAGLSLCFLIVGCASGNCRSNQQGESKKEMAEKGRILRGEDSVASPKNLSEGRVFVFKPDGSLQCQSGKKISPDEMKQELKDIPVFKSYSQHDGRLHPQICGAPTGKVNVYEIDAESLAAAEKLGFKLFKPD